MKRYSSLAFIILMFYSAVAQKFVPPTGKTLLIVGQDLASINGYTSDGDFPTPGGTTAYISLYDCANPDAYFPFGGLGEYLDGSAAPDIDWGSGPLNAHNCAFGYPQSALAIGLYMTEEFVPGGLSKIASGDYDTEVTRLATFIASTNAPVYLRIGYEFDGNWNIGYDNTTNFKNAFKHIVDIIRPIAPNCEMVLQACTSPVDDIIENTHEDIADWYPGDEYVDWLGYSWFLNRQLQFDLTDEVLALAKEHNKPVMVCESAPQGYDIANLQRKNINTMLDGVSGTGAVNKTGQEIWDEWYVPYFKYIHDHADQIRAVAYINCNWDTQAKWASPYNEGYWGDTRVQADETIKTNWINEITSDFWLHGSDSLFSVLIDGLDTTIVYNAPPKITVEAPLYTSIPLGNDIQIAATIIDDDTLTAVNIFVNDELRHSQTSASLSWTLSSPEMGKQSIRIEATDNHEHTSTKKFAVAVTDTTSGTITIGDHYVPEDGKTLLLIGQTYIQEYADYVTGTGLAPAGSSHYAELYSGTINQGDDGNSEAFIDYMETNYPGAYAELAISIKDNPASGGYSGPNASWKACVDIANGVWNDEIDAIAQSLKKRDLKFLLRIGYEVSLMAMANKTETEFIDILTKYNDLGINPLENATQVEEFDLDAYKNAFNYIANRIRNVNQVENVAFVYHPVRGFNDAKNLYPGDEYVDWFGLLFFNHDVCWPTWEGATPPFENCPNTEVADGNLLQCLDWAKDDIKKPIIIAEAAVQSHTTEQADAAHKTGYIQKVADLINLYDIKAWVYINSNWVGHGWNDVWGDSRVEADQTVLSYWLNEVQKPRYIHYQKRPYTPQSIQLNAGWNLVSLYVQPVNASIQNLFANASKAKSMDRMWNKQYPSYLNSFNTMQAGQGYQIYNSISETVIIKGTPISSIANPLQTGWNLVCTLEDLSIPDYSAQSSSTILSIKDLRNFWLPNTNGSLDNLKAGKAYFVKAE